MENNQKDIQNLYILRIKCKKEGITSINCSRFDKEKNRILIAGNTNKEIEIQKLNSDEKLDENKYDDFQLDKVSSQKSYLSNIESESSNNMIGNILLKYKKKKIVKIYLT